MKIRATARKGANEGGVCAPTRKSCGVLRSRLGRSEKRPEIVRNLGGRDVVHADQNVAGKRRGVGRPPRRNATATMWGRLFSVRVNVTGAPADQSPMSSLSPSTTCANSSGDARSEEHTSE